MKYNIIALFGKSGAGKDTIQNWIVSNYPDINKIVSMTTRPPRENEVEGKDYYFTNNSIFFEKILEGTMLEATEFRDWFYGTPIESLNKDKINIGVFNPAGIACLLENSELNLIPVYVDVNDKVRLIRCLNRESNPDCAEIIRRYQTDNKDFMELFAENDFRYYTLDNNTDNIEHLTEDIRMIIEGLNTTKNLE